MLRCMTNTKTAEKQDWFKYIKHVVFATRSSPIAGTHITPFEAARGRLPRLVIDNPLARPRCARVPADELRPLNLELRVGVQHRPRDFTAEKPRAAAARVTLRARAEERAHAWRGVVARERDEALEPVVPLAEVTDDEAHDRAEGAQPVQHGPVVAGLRAAEARVDAARVVHALALDLPGARVHGAAMAREGTVSAVAARAVRAAADRIRRRASGVEHLEFRECGRRRRAVDKPLELDLEVGHKPLPLAALRALAPALHEAPRVRLRRRRDDGREDAVHLRRVPDAERVERVRNGELDLVMEPVEAPVEVGRRARGFQGVGPRPDTRNARGGSDPPSARPVVLGGGGLDPPGRIGRARGGVLDPPAPAQAASQRPQRPRPGGQPAAPETTAQQCPKQNLVVN